MKYLLPYSLVFFGFFFAFGQSDNDKGQSKTDFKFNILEAGPYLAIPVGKSFISNSDYEVGFDLKSNLILQDKYIIGIGYNQIHLKNHDFSRTGYYGKTRNNALYIQLGYLYRVNERFTTSLNYAIGKSIYKHQLFNSGEDFEDDALYNDISIKFNYLLGGYVSLNFYAGYRIDVLDIDVPEQLSTLYDNARYFNTGFSISLFVN